MSDLDTKNAIQTNLRSIITTTIGYNLENISSDPDVETTPNVFIDIEGEDYGDNHEESKKSNELLIRLLTIYRGLSNVLINSKFFEITYNFRSSITVDNLNVGDLAVSKLVTWVTHLEARKSVDNLLMTVNYNLNIRYKEI